MRKLSTLSAAAALVLLSACASSHDVEGLAGGAGGACTSCHGGRDNDTGAPPTDVQLATTASAGAHTAHVDAGVDCTACHRFVDRTRLDFTNHQNNRIDVDFGSIALITTVTPPAYDSTSHSCSNVYCHKQGGAQPAPAWNAPAGSVRGCGDCHVANPHGGAIGSHSCNECHATSFEPGSSTTVAGPSQGGTHADGSPSVRAHTDPSWIVTNANGVTPHGMAALYRNRAQYPRGLDGCRSCHGADLNAATAIVAGVKSCDSCHQPYSNPGSAGTDWRTDCTFCHGDATRTRAAFTVAAPPRDVDGNVAGTAKIGAHQVHLVGKVLSVGVSCSNCHGGASRSLPTDFLHVVGTTEVTLKRPDPLNVRPGAGVTGTYDRTAGTCANTYCHGNLPRNPVTTNTPSWTATSGQTSCDTCHAPNGALGGTGTRTDHHDLHRCDNCHSATLATVGCQGCHEGGYQRQLGTTPPTVNLEAHVDGLVEIVQTTVVLRNNRVIHITYDPSTRSCSTDCHSLRNAGGTAIHGNVSNPQTW